jgi:hypothetical protein
MTAKEYADKWIAHWGLDPKLGDYLPELLEEVWQAAETETLRQVNSIADHNEMDISYVDADTVANFNGMWEHERKKVRYLNMESDVTSKVCTKFDMEL